MVQRRRTARATRRLRTRARRTQRGGWCAPCAIPAAKAITAGHVAAGGVGASVLAFGDKLKKGFTKIFSQRSSSVQRSGKRPRKRTMVQVLVQKSGKPGHDMVVRLDVDNGKARLRKGTKIVPIKGRDPFKVFRDTVKRCEETGYQKCSGRKKSTRSKRSKKKPR